MVKFEKILIWILRIGLTLVLLSPLVTSWELFFPYISLRAVYFQIITEFLLLISLLLLLFFPSYRPAKWSPLAMALAAYFSIGFISAFLSPDPTKSLFGTIERAMGTYNLFHFGILFLVCRITLRRAVEWHIFLGISVSISIIPAADFLFEKYFANIASPSSLTGNPIFFAAYVIIHIFFAAYLCTVPKKPLFKFLFAAAAIILIITLFATHVRGAFLGISASTVFLLGHAAWKNEKWRIHIAALLLILIGSYAMLYLNRDAEFVQKSAVLNRITNFTFQDNTIRSRLILWDIALKGFFDHPLLGWGRENYSLVFNHHFDPDFQKIPLSESWEDRAHNIFMDELIAAGILGLISYVWIQVAALHAVKEKPFLVALLVAYFMQNLFGVDTLNSYLPFFIFLGFADFLSSPQQETATHKKIPFRFSIGAGVLGTAVLVAVSFLFTVRPVLGNYFMFKSYKSHSYNKLPEQEEYFSKAKKTLQGFPYLLMESLNVYTQGITANAPYLVENNIYFPYADRITEEVEKLYARVQDEHRWSIIIANLYLSKASITREITYLDKADEILATVQKLSPQRQLFNDTYLTSQQIRRQILQSARPSAPST